MIPFLSMNVTGKRGFTLLEVMAAMAIIAIALVGIYQLQAQAILMSEKARFYTVAPLLAQMKMADFDINLSNMPSQDSGNFDDDGYSGYAWQVQTENMESKIFTDSSQAIKRIDLKISLNEGRNVYNIRTYRYIFAE